MEKEMKIFYSTESNISSEAKLFAPIARGTIAVLKSGNDYSRVKICHILCDETLCYRLDYGDYCLARVVDLFKIK